MKTREGRLGINQEMFVGNASEKEFLKWVPDREQAGFLELSEEAEREFVASELDEEFEQGRERKKRRWRMQREARRLLYSCCILRTVESGPDKGEVKEHSFAVADCCRHPVTKPGDGRSHLVEVRVSSDSGRAFFAKVKRCGSVWTCPICAAKITEKKRKELRDCLKYYAAKGGRVYLLTLTIPHHAGKETAVWRDCLLRAYGKMRNRTFWREWAKRICLEGSIRALEVTYGPNGAHVHIHILLFCMSSATPVASDLLREWQSACVALGLPEPNEHGVNIEDGTYAADYVGKWGLDCELTKAHVKRGGLGGRTPWDLLEASANGDTRAGQLFVEYAMAFFGQRQLVWSTGLRQKLGLDSEKTDQQLSEEVTEEATLVAEIPPDDWDRIVRFEAHADLLIAAEERGSEGVKAFLRSLNNRATCDRVAHVVWRN
jgi:hypothetical protein